MIKYMMATEAHHKTGDLSRSPAEICRVDDEDEVDYIGSWLAGLGFIKVHFPKRTTRELTPEEKARYNGMKFGMPGEPKRTIIFPEV